MPKRFTASEKWGDRWFRSLKMRDKLLWFFILDNCDHAGLWEPDLDLASTYVRGTGEDVPAFEEEEVFQTFAGRIEVAEDRWFVPKFVYFQYGRLKEESKVHASVIERLKRYGVYEFYLRWLKDYLREAGKPLPEEVQSVAKEPKKQYAEFVHLTEREYAKLIKQVGGERQAKECIEILDNYKGSKGRTYTSDYRAILNWVIDAWRQRRQKSGLYSAHPLTLKTMTCPYCKQTIKENDRFSHWQENVCPEFKVVSPEQIADFRKELAGLETQMDGKSKKKEES